MGTAAPRQTPARFDHADQVRLGAARATSRSPASGTLIGTTGYFPDPGGSGTMTAPTDWVRARVSTPGSAAIAGVRLTAGWASRPPRWVQEYGYPSEAPCVSAYFQRWLGLAGPAIPIAGRSARGHTPLSGRTNSEWSGYRGAATPAGESRQSATLQSAARSRTASTGVLAPGRVRDQTKLVAPWALDT